MVKYIILIIKSIMFRPRGLKYVGKNSYIKRPSYICNCQHVSIGGNVLIHKNSRITPITIDSGKHYNPEIIIGDNVYIGENIHLHSMSKLIIGDECVISDDVYISGASHGLMPGVENIMKQPLSYQDISIGNNSFIGRGVFISQGVTLGHHCVVGANSVVTKSFNSYTMLAGVPAKIIKRYSHDKKQWVRANN